MLHLYYKSDVDIKDIVAVIAPIEAPGIIIEDAKKLITIGTGNVQWDQDIFSLIHTKVNKIKIHTCPEYVDTTRQDCWGCMCKESCLSFSMHGSID